MLVNIDLDDYTDKMLAMHCDTYEKALAFLGFLDKNGRTWGNGDSYLSIDRYEFYLSDTCYAFNISEYCYKNYYENNGYTVLEIDDFIVYEEYDDVNIMLDDFINQFNTKGGIMYC